MIYLDNAATTFPKPECVYQALDIANRTLAFNAGRGHYKNAENASNVIEETRNKLCQLGNSRGAIFTSSATQALNNIIGGLELSTNDIVYCSPYDHNAIARALHGYQKAKGFEVKLIPLKDDLSIDLEKFDFLCMQDQPKAVFCTHISNVTGYVLPVYEIGNIVKQNNSLYIVDGAQALGLVEVDIRKMNADYYVFAGHKTLYGPLGIAGYLYQNNDLNVTFYGGTGTESLNLNMPSSDVIRYEPSSMNVNAIYGLGTSIDWIKQNNPVKVEEELTNYLIECLSRYDEISIYRCDCYSIGIVSINIEGFTSEEIAKILADDFDICVRAGYHCCPYIHQYLDTIKTLGTVRISLSCFNSKEDIDLLISGLETIIDEVI